MVLHIMWFSAEQGAGGGGAGRGAAGEEDKQGHCKSLNSLPKSFPCPKQTEDAPEAERTGQDAMYEIAWISVSLGELEQLSKLPHEFGFIGFGGDLMSLGIQVSSLCLRSSE